MKYDLRLDAGRVFVRTPYAPALVDRFRSIPGREYHGETKEWSFPAAPDCVSMLCDCLGILPSFLPDDVRAAAGRDGYLAVRALAVDLSVLEGIRLLTEPYEHQRVNLARLLTHDRWLLADEMGTGKTKTVVDRLYSRRHGEDDYEGMPVLIVCPKSVVSVWEEELRKHARARSVVIDSNDWRKPCPGGGRPDWRYNITNYERLLHADPGLEEWPWGTVVFDEIHRLKNFTAKTTRVARKLSEQARHVYGLSGTPAPNGLEDWLGVLSVIDPVLLPVKTKTAFQARYCVRGRLSDDPASPMYHVFKTVGYRNVQELHSKVAAVTSRVTKAECLDLPEKVFQTRTVTLAGEQARVYRELKRDAVARLTALKNRRHQTESLEWGCFEREQAQDKTATLTVRNVLTESLRLLQVVGGFVPDDDGRLHELPDKAKVETLAELLDDLPPGKQVVVWCAFKSEVEYLYRWLTGTRKETAVWFTGDTKATLRPELIEAFRTGAARFFVGTSAGGEGINGLQVADVEVFYSRNWNLKDFLQMQDRLHRIGQKSTVTVVNLVARGTVDEKVEEALKTKAALQDMLLQNPENLF